MKLEVKIKKQKIKEKKIEIRFRNEFKRNRYYD